MLFRRTAMNWDRVGAAMRRGRHSARGSGGMGSLAHDQRTKIVFFESECAHVDRPRAFPHVLQAVKKADVEDGFVSVRNIGWSWPCLCKQ